VRKQRMLWRLAKPAERKAATRPASRSVLANSANNSADMPVGIAELGAILRRRWITIAATTALFTSLGLVYALTTKSLYVASTVIFVDPRARASFQIEGSGTGGGYDPNLVDSQSIVIESEAVLRRVIEKEKLADDPEFSRGPGDKQSNALRNLQAALKVKRPDKTYVVEIQVRSEYPAKAARLADQVASAYLSDGRATKAETAQREQSWLDTHLANLQARLKEAEARVEAYKAENRLVGTEGKLVGEQQLSELNRLLVDAQRKSAEAKAMFDQVEELRRSGRTPDVTVEALKSPVIDRLRGQMSEILRLEANARTTLGPRHPAALEIREQIVETRRQIGEELTRIAEGARAAYNVAQKNVVTLEKRLEELKTDSTSTNKTLLRLRELERAVDAQKAVYEKFLRDKEQIARLTVDTPAGRVITPAVVPQAKAFPNRPVILALAFAMGLMVGIGLALTIETLTRARQGRGTRRRIGLGHEAGISPTEEAPQLAMLPRPEGVGNLRWLGRGRNGALAGIDTFERQPDSAYAQEVRSLARAILDRVEDRETATLMISGTRANIGSPVLAANLARALGAEGGDVLLVDGYGSLLSSRLAQGASPATLDVAGRRRVVLTCPGRNGTFHFLPFGGVTQTPSRRLPHAGTCALVLIDGPAMEGAKLNLSHFSTRIDGVIALLPPGMDPADAALSASLGRKFGESLLGIVSQAA